MLFRQGVGPNRDYETDGSSGDRELLDGIRFPEIKTEGCHLSLSLRSENIHKVSVLLIYDPATNQFEPEPVGSTTA